MFFSNVISKLHALDRHSLAASIKLNIMQPKVAPQCFRKTTFLHDMGMKL